jgi:tetratricopeptide (TPR) repeat protein
MSAAPRPQTDESPESADAEGWALLEGLRRRLDEHANQNRKIQTQVTQLAESIAAMVEQQRKRSRWLDVNSFVAYLIFTVLCGGAFYFLYQSRARELVADKSRVSAERDAAVRRADEATKKAAARDAADAKAWDAYQLLEAGKRDEAAKKLVELQAAPLSQLERTVLETKAKQAEVVQIDLALKSAAASFKAGRHAEVVAPLLAALALDPNGPRAPLVHYYLGVAAAKAGALDDAISHLQAAVDGNVDLEDARFHLASALDRAGQWGKAKIEYDRFATAHPMSSYTWYATRRGGALARMPAVRPAGAAKDAAAFALASGTSPATAQPPAPPTPGSKAAALKAAVPNPAGSSAGAPNAGAPNASAPTAAVPKGAAPKPSAPKPVTPAPTKLDFTNDDPAADGSAAQ